MRKTGRMLLILVCVGALAISIAYGQPERQINPIKIRPAAVGTSGYKFILSSGPFSLPAGAQSVDWAVVNDSSGSQTIRVTVYKCGLGEAKTAVAPGAIEMTLGPGFSTHNANSVGSVFSLGFLYEVVVETNDKRTLPCVQVWQDHSGTVIAGTLIPAGNFVDIK
jgi:hypothetical protein